MLLVYTWNKENHTQEEENQNNTHIIAKCILKIKGHTRFCFVYLVEGYVYEQPNPKSTRAKCISYLRQVLFVYRGTVTPTTQR